MKNYRKVNGRLPDEDVERIVQSAVGSNRLEGLYSSPEEIDMLRKYVRGDVTDDEYDHWVHERAGVIV